MYQNLNKREELAKDLYLLISKNNESILISKIFRKIYFILIPIFLIYSITLWTIAFSYSIPIIISSFIFLLIFNIHKLNLKIKTLNKKNKYLSYELTENKLKMQELIQNHSKTSLEVNKEKELLIIKKHLLLIEYLVKLQNMQDYQNYFNNLKTTEDTPAFRKTLEIINQEKNLTLKRKLK